MYARLCFFITSILVLTPIIAYAQAPVHIWSGGYGDSDYDHCQAIATDASGDCVIAGYFFGSIDLGGGQMTSAGDMDVYIAKFDPWGHHLWSERFGDWDIQDAVSLTIDSDGSIIVVGTFLSTVNFGGRDLTSAGWQDIWIAKFDGDGNHLWSNRYGDADPQTVAAVTCDDSGDIYMFGSLTGTVDFGGGPLTASSGSDLYVVKFSGTNGAHVWSNAFYGNNDDGAGAIAVDALDNVYLTGTFQGTIDFGGGVLTDSGNGDIFLVKLSAEGAHLWSHRFGDASGASGHAIAIANDGNVVTAGHFWGSVNFGGGNLTSAGEHDVYVARFNTGGGHVWSERYGGTGSQLMRDVAVDIENRITVIGEFEGSIDFGGGSLVSAGNDDIFVATLDSGGNHVWSRRFGDSGYQAGEALALDPFGGVVMTGWFASTVDFNGYVPLYSAGTTDIFVARFGERPDGACAGSIVGIEPDALVQFSSYSHTELGSYISALQDFEVCAIGIGLTIAQPVPMVAKIYEADGTTRGSLLALGEFMAAGPGDAVNYVPVHHLLESCNDYDIAIEFGNPLDVLAFDEDDVSYPFDVGGVIRVRKAEQWGSTAATELPLLVVIGGPVGPREYTELAPPETPWFPGTDTQTEWGVFVSALKTIRVCALRWAADFSVVPATVTAKIYEANGTSRGWIVAAGTGVVETTGMAMHSIPISAVLEEGKDYDIAVEFDSAWWEYVNEAAITLPCDVGDVITVRDGEQGGNPSVPVLHHFALEWTPSVAGTPYDLGKYAEGYPPPFSTTDSNTNYGLYVTSLTDQSIFSLGWQANVMPGEALNAWVYEATGTSRGTLLSHGTVTCGADGMRWHDLPVAVDLDDGAEYNIEIGFGQVNEWRYWEDYAGVPYVSSGLFSVYSGSQGGSPFSHRIPYMRVNECNTTVTGTSQGPAQPPRFTLGVPRPNPGTGLVTVHYSLDRDARVTMAVHDVTGRRIETLLSSETRPAGPGWLTFDTSSVPSGVYFVKMNTESKSVSRKITIIK